jgi:hypothetical protein
MKVHIRLLGDCTAVDDVTKLLEAVYNKTVDATGELTENFIDATGKGCMRYICFEVVPLDTVDQVDA